MVSSIFRTLGLIGSTPTDKHEKQKRVQESVRALPANWYTSQEMYELEKRAIFHRRWLMITHSHRLKNVGDWLHYDCANTDFVLYRHDDGEIRGARDAVDARQIRDSRPVHIHIDYNGLIWVNLDPNDTPEIQWDELFAGADRQERYGTLDFNNYEFDHSWQMVGPYNWKMASDNYNECYHCTTTHPDLVNLTDLHAYYVETEQGCVKHFVATKPEQEAKGLRVHPTYYYPSTSMNISRDFFMLQRFIPHGPTKSVMYYEVYRNKNATSEDFQLINELYKRVMSEDKALCELAQRNVNAGLFINGEMHPKMEKGPLYIQKLARDDCIEIRKREQAPKRTSWPIPASLPGMPTNLFWRDTSGGLEDVLRQDQQFRHQIAAY